MADEHDNPVKQVVETGERAHAAHHLWETAAEARTAYAADGLLAAGRAAAAGVAGTALWAIGGEVVLHASGVFASAEDKLPYGHGEGVPNHSTLVPASDPQDPSKVPVDGPTAHGPLMSYAPEVSSPNPQLSQEAPATHGPQQSGDPQLSSDPQLSGGHQWSHDPQMSQAPELSTHNPGAEPDPGYHHH